MTPEGWYPDPSAPAYLRWWDGATWTEHVSARPLPAVPPTPTAPMTPDGALLAGWWERAVAQLIDGFLQLVLALAVGFPFVLAIVRAFGDYLQQVIDAADAGDPAPGQFAIYGDVFLPFLGYSLVSLLVAAIYGIGFLKAKGATPGKMMMGLNVRLRDRPGPLSWSTVVRHWAAQNWYVAIGWIPFVGSLGGLWVLVDCLWPLRDNTRQALHDRFAATNVVRVSKA